MICFQSISFKKCIVFILAILLAANIFSLDMAALQLSLANEKNDSVKVDILLSISDMYASNHNKALYYELKAKAIAEKIDNPFSKIYVYCAIGNTYDVNGEIQLAISFYKMAITTSLALQDEKMTADIYSDLASIYKNHNILDSSLFYNFKALDLRKKNADKRSIAISLHNIALVYRKKNDWDNAFINYSKCLSLFTELGDEKNICKTLTNMGMFYKNKLVYDSVFYYFDKATPLAKKNNDEYSLYQINLNTALCYTELNRFNDAVSILNILYKDERLKNDADYPWLIYGLGVANVGLKNYNDGINYLKNALTKTYKKSNYEYLGKVNASLSEAYEKMGNNMLALQYYKAFRSYSDSLYTQQNTENVNKLFAVYKTREKEQEIVLLNKENLVKDLQLTERKKTSLLYALGLILVSIVAAGIFYLYRNKRMVSEQLAEKNKIISVSLKEKEVLLKEIHHRVKNNLQVISSLLNLQSKSISDEKALLALNEGRNRVKSMALIHQNLYRDDNLMGVDVKEYIEKLIDSLFTSYNIEPNKIRLITDIDPLQLDVDTVIPLGLILNELISNALKYAYTEKENGLLEIKLKIENEVLLLIVNDDGKGIDNDDLNKNNSSSMGHKLVQSFLQKLGATMNVEKNNGTHIQLSIHKFKLT